MSAFRVGQKVACVHTGLIIANGFNMIGEGLELRRIYVVREILVAKDCGLPCLRLAGVHRGVHRYGWRLIWDEPFLAERFRPLTTRTAEQDAELFAPWLKAGELEGAPL